jgi:hypothetical protein
MKTNFNIQPILQAILPPELQAYSDLQVWRTVGAHLLSKFRRKHRPS